MKSRKQKYIPVKINAQTNQWGLLVINDHLQRALFFDPTGHAIDPDLKKRLMAQHPRLVKYTLQDLRCCVQKGNSDVQILKAAEVMIANNLWPPLYSLQPNKKTQRICQLFNTVGSLHGIEAQVDIMRYREMLSSYKKVNAIERTVLIGSFLLKQISDVVISHPGSTFLFFAHDAC